MRQAVTNPGQHLLRGQAPDRAEVPLGRDPGGDGPAALQAEGSPQRRRRRRAGRQDPEPARDLGHGPRLSQGLRRGVLRRARDGSRHHRPGPFQRRPAAGHQGRGHDLRARGPARHQRADRRRPGLRPRRQEERPGRRLRPRRRDVRHHHPRDRATASSTSWPPTATPTSAARTSTTASSSGWRRAFKAETGIDLGDDKLALQRVKEAAEKAKRELSFTTETEINLPFISSDRAKSNHIRKTLSRTTFEAMTADLVERTLPAHRDRPWPTPSSTADRIDQVILVGGQTRMPLVQERVTKFFGRAAGGEGRPRPDRGHGRGHPIGHPRRPGPRPRPAARRDARSPWASRPRTTATR